MIGFIFALIASFILPIGACIYYGVKRRASKAVLIGILCFVFFQMIVRLPLLQVILPMSAGFLLFQSTNPVLYLALVALSAGVFEECGRYILMRFCLKKMSLNDGIAFGVGHGGIEALLMVGVNLMVMLPAGIQSIAAFSSADFFVTGAERIFTMCVHIALSVMIWRAVQYRKPYLLPAAILLHGFINFAAAYLVYLGVNLFVVEAVIALFAAGLLVYTVLMSKKVNKEEMSV